MIARVKWFGVAVALAAIGVVSACARSERRRTERCLADEVGLLRPEWRVIEDCTVDNPACREACRARDADACLNRAFALEAEHHPEAPIWFERACRLGLALGCTNWGAGTWARAVVGNPTANVSRGCVLRVFRRACDAGESMGCGMVGRYQIENSVSPFEPAIGAAQLVSACGRFNGPPCRMLAYYFELGMVGPQTSTMSSTLMQRACDGRDEAACGHGTAIETFHAVSSD